jgi:membrane protein required for beta-lactamase induction
MSKISNSSNPYREAYNELQRVMVSNRFIFTQGAIIYGIFLVLGPIPLIVYLAVGTVLILLALAFEKPYQLLRRLLPYGNWTPHLTALPVRVKIFSVIMVIVLIIMYMAIIYSFYQFIFPSAGDTCIGSLACILLRHIF